MAFNTSSSGCMRSSRLKYSSMFQASCIAAMTWWVLQVVYHHLKKTRATNHATFYWPGAPHTSVDGDGREPVQHGSRVEAVIQPTSAAQQYPQATNNNTSQPFNEATAVSPKTSQEQYTMLFLTAVGPRRIERTHTPTVGGRPTLHTAGPSFRGHRLRDAVKEVVPVKRQHSPASQASLFLSSSASASSGLICFVFEQRTTCQMMRTLR